MKESPLITTDSRNGTLLWIQASVPTLLTNERSSAFSACISLHLCFPFLPELLALLQPSRVQRFSSNTPRPNQSFEKLLQNISKVIPIALAK